MSIAKLQRQARGLLIGYGIQFLAGMFLNTLVTLPTSHPGTTGNEYFSRSARSMMWAFSGQGGWQLTVHAYIALLLVAGSIALLVSAWKHGTMWRWTTGVAAFFTVGAFFNGLSFLNYNEGVSSLIMAVCWLIAVSALVIACVSSSSPARAAS